MDTIKKTTKLYFKAAWSHKYWLALHLFTVSVAVIAGSIVLPYITSRGINTLTTFLRTGGVFWKTFGGFIVAFIIFEIIDWVAWRISGLAVVNFEIKTMRDLYRKVFDHLMQMSSRFFNDTFGGSLVAQTNRFVASMEKIYDVISFDLLILFIRLIFSTIILLTFAPVIGIGLIAWTVIFTASAVFLSIKKLRLSKKAAQNQSSTTARLSDDFTNIANIKYFAREKYEISKFRSVTEQLKTAMTWDWGIQEVIFAWQGILSIVFEIFVFWFSLYLVVNHKINLGQLVLIQFYIGNVISSLWNVPRIVRRLESGFADAAEMSDTLYTKPEITDVDRPMKNNIGLGEIQFNDVCFGHDASYKQLFNKLSFYIQPGEKVGFAGPSGGGKTTITNLLLRLADIESGVIQIDGQDISKLKQTDLRASITYVPQEPILFHRSLFENIKYGNLDATDKQVMEAAQKAHADEFIEKLPLKYDTLVGERGVKLSGGQRQRIAIARAIIKDAPILVLDEATSALDSQSERLIQDALWKLMQGRTAIVIAHRLSTIQKLDRILIIDGGEIVEEGNHNDLLAQKGLYAKLWAHQSGGFIK